MNLFHPGRFVRIGLIRPGKLLLRFICPRCLTTFYMETLCVPETPTFRTWQAHCPVCGTHTDYADATGEAGE